MSMHKERGNWHTHACRQAWERAAVKFGHDHIGKIQKGPFWGLRKNIKNWIHNLNYFSKYVIFSSK
jgi:hypothetical protein